MEDGPTTAEPARARRRARWWVVLTAVLVGVLTVVTGAGVLARDNDRLAGREAVGAATGRATESVRDLAVVMQAARVALAESAGRVVDDDARTALRAALDAAEAAARAHGATVREIDAATARVVSSRDALTAATAAVSAEVASWELARAKADWSAAVDHLGETLSAARGLLDASAGRVTDDGVRQSLARAVESARPLAVRDAPTGVAALSAGAAAAGAAADSIASLEAAVTASAAAWTQTQPAAARPATPPKASAASPSTAGQSSGPPGAATPLPAPTTNDGHWETTVTYEDLRICGDTEGNSWEC